MGGDKVFHFRDCAVEGSQTFHLHAGNGGCPETGLAGWFGEAQGGVGADAGIAAATATDEGGGVEEEFVLLMGGVNEDAIGMGQDDFFGSEVGIELGGFENVGLPGEVFGFDHVTFEDIDVGQGLFHLRPGFVFQFFAAQNTHKSLHVGCDGDLFFMEGLNDVQADFAAQAGANDCGRGGKIFYICGSDGACYPGDGKIAQIRVGGGVIQGHEGGGRGEGGVAIDAGIAEGFDDMGVFLGQAGDDRDTRSEFGSGMGSVIDSAAIHIFGFCGGDNFIFGVIADVKYVVGLLGHYVFLVDVRCF